MRDCILHLADLHLGATVEPRLDDDQRSRLERVRNGVLDRLAEWITADNSPVGLVLIAGDLFDRHDPPPELVGQVRVALSQIARTVPVITLPGNHDELSYAHCVYRQGDWPGTLVTTAGPSVVWRGELASGRACTVVSAAYQAGKVPPGQKVALPSRRDVLGSDGEDGVLIGVLHGTLSDRFPPDFAKNERCFCLSHQDAAKSGYNYLALGHFHRRQQWNAGGSLAHYPGPPLGPRVSDPGCGAFSLVHFEAPAARIEAIDARPILGCRWQITDLQTTADQTVQEIAERIAASLPGDSDSGVLPVVCLEGTTHQANLPEAVQQCLSESGRKCLVVGADLQEVIPPEVDRLAQEESLVGYFVRCWKAWSQAENPPPEKTTAVLYEGLFALGWGENRGRAEP